MENEDKGVLINNFAKYTVVIFLNVSLGLLHRKTLGGNGVCFSTARAAALYRNFLVVVLRWELIQEL